MTLCCDGYCIISEKKAEGGGMTVCVLCSRKHALPSASINNEAILTVWHDRTETIFYRAERLGRKLRCRSCHLRRKAACLPAPCRAAALLPAAAPCENGRSALAALARSGATARTKLAAGAALRAAGAGGGVAFARAGGNVTAWSGSSAGAGAGGKNRTCRRGNAAAPWA